MIDLNAYDSCMIYLYSDKTNLPVINWIDPGDFSVARVTGGSPLSAAGDSTTFAVYPSG